MTNPAGPIEKQLEEPLQGEVWVIPVEYVWREKMKGNQKEYVEIWKARENTISARIFAYHTIPILFFKW